MMEKLESASAALCKMDESLMDMHGLGVLDGYSYSFLVKKKETLVALGP